MFIKNYHAGGSGIAGHTAAARVKGRHCPAELPVQGSMVDFPSHFPRRYRY